MKNLEIIDINSMEEDKELQEREKELSKKKERKINEVLQHLKGNLVTKLLIHEYLKANTIIFRSSSQSRTDGIPHYHKYTNITTGVFNGVELNYKLAIKGDDNFNWDCMYLYNGPNKNISELDLSLSSKLLKSENGEVMLWNGNLPKYIYENRPEASLPYSCGANLSSEVIVIGDNAVTKIFGLKPKKSGMNTEWIYKRLLKKQGLNPNKVLSHWVRKKSGSLDSDLWKFSDELQKLEKKVKQFPEKFFEKYINTLFPFKQYLKQADAKRSESLQII